MRRILFASLAMAAAAGLTQGEELVRYSFGSPGDETTSESSIAFNASFSIANVTATPITDPNGTIGIEISSAATTPAGAPFMRVDPQGSSTTAAAAFTANKYFQFTLTPAQDFSLNLDSIAFDVARGGNGTPRGYELRSSVDNFAASLIGGDVGTVRPTYTGVNLAFDQSFDALTTPVTFRVYAYSPAGGSSVDFDNIVVNGAVTAVPEPTTMGLALGALGLLALRRRN